MAMRSLLVKMDKRPGAPATSWPWPCSTPPTRHHQPGAPGMVNVGFQAQRHSRSTVLRSVGQADGAPAATVGTAPIKEQVIHFINKKLPGGLPTKDGARAADIEDKDYVPIIRNPQATTADSEAVFYFPGCGSERLFSQVGLATRPCCGTLACRPCCRRATCAAATPARQRPVRQGREDDHRQPRAVPPRGQHAELPRHQDRGGELRHLLRPVAGLRVRQDLPGSRIVDIHEFLLEKGIQVACGPGRLPVPRALPQPHEAGRLDEDRARWWATRCSRATAAAANRARWA